MSEKITLQDVTDKLSERLGVTKKMSDDFLREFFSLIETSLEKDGIAKIKGLGVFKVKEVEERKSVNVQSGAEIVIPAHYKVSFVPDKALSTDINKPYAHLETYILDEEGGPVEAPVNLSEDDDESVLDLEEEEKSSELEVEQRQSMNSADEGTDTSAEAKPEERPIQPEIVEPQPVQVVDVPSNPIIEEKQQQEEIPSQPEVVETPDLTVTENQDTVVETTNEKTEASNSRNSESEEPKVSPVIVSSSEPEPDRLPAVDDTEKNSIPEIAKSEVAVVQNDNDKSDKGNDKPENGDSKWLRFLIIVLILAILGFVGYYYSGEIRSLLMQGKEDVPAMVDTTIVTKAEEPVQEEAPVMDTAGNYDDMSNENFAVNEIKEEDPNEGNVQLQTTHSVYNFDKELVDYMKANHPEAHLNITNVADVVKIGKGQRLVDLALKYYGHKYFWVYIYYFNKDVIRNPNSLPSGIEVKIPEVDKSLVDYTNENVVDMAFDVKINLIEK